MYLNLYSAGPLIIVRAPDTGVRWVKLMQAAGRILRQHGLRSKDLTSVDSEGLENVQKLEEAFSGAHWFRRFMLYDFDVASGEFKLARGAIDE